MACALSIKRRTGWKPRCLSGIHAIRPGMQLRSAHSADRCRPAHRCNARRRQNSQESNSSVTSRSSRNMRWITICWWKAPRNLQDYLQSEGYFDAEVEFKEQNVINDRATIDYLVTTGDRGTSWWPSRSAAIDYFTHRSHSRADVSADRRVPAVPARPVQREPAARDEDSILNLYQSNGFRDVQVTVTGSRTITAARPATSPCSLRSRRDRSISSAA